MSIKQAPSERSSYLELVSGIPNRRRVRVTSRKLTEKVAKGLQSQISRLNDRPGDILVQFKSPGGAHQAGKNMFDILRVSKERTIGLVIVSANSAAFIALQGCHLRLASESSSLVVHNPEVERYERIKHSSRPENSASACERAIQTIQVQREWLIDMILQKSEGKMTRDKLRILLDDGRTLNAEEALKYGFIDGIV